MNLPILQRTTNIYSPHNLPVYSKLQLQHTLALKQFIIPIAFVTASLLAGCSRHQQSIIGRYKSKEYSFISKYYLHLIRNTSFIIGSSIEIKSDSTYVLTNCGNIEEGKWEIRDDSLLLFCKDNRWRIDSLNRTGFKGEFLDCGDGKPSIFTIDGGMLKQTQENGKRRRLYNFEKSE